MTDNTESVLQSDDFNSLSLGALCAFLSLEQMEFVDEVRLYRSAVTWAKSQKGDQPAEISDGEIRNVLQQALFLIRLPTVDAKEFSDICGAANVLSDSEKSQIYHYILSGKSDITDKTVAGFSAINRVVSCEYTIQRYSGYSLADCNSNVADICFSSSVAVYLTGVGIYGRQDGSPIARVKLDIIDNTGKNLNTITVRDIPCTGTDTPVPIRWGAGVNLRQDTKYQVRVIIDSYDEAYRGLGGASQVTVDNSTFTFFKSSSDPDEFEGIIPELLFRKLPK